MNLTHFAAATALTALALVVPASAQTTPVPPTIVLVHGAWTDGSSWDAVITTLQRDGYTVVDPPNPLRGVAYDAAYLGAFLKTIKGPIVLAGHSYGGAVMTVAAAGNSDVKALIYIAAYAPDVGDSVLSLTSKAPGSELSPDKFNVVPFLGQNGKGDADLYIKPSEYPNVFASDSPPATAAVMAAAQRPLANSALTEPAGAAAWKTIPSWFLITDHDRVLPPAVQELMAERAHGQVTHVASAHPAPVSHPNDVVRVILAAVRAEQQTAVIKP